MLMRRFWYTARCTCFASATCLGPCFVDFLSGSCRQTLATWSKEQRAMLWGSHSGFILLLHVARRPAPATEGLRDSVKLQFQDLVGPGPAGEEGPWACSMVHFFFFSFVCVCVALCSCGREHSYMHVPSDCGTAAIAGLGPILSFAVAAGGSRAHAPVRSTQTRLQPRLQLQTEDSLLSAKVQRSGGGGAGRQEKSGPEAGPSKSEEACRSTELRRVWWQCAIRQQQPR